MNKCKLDQSSSYIDSRFVNTYICFEHVHLFASLHDSAHVSNDCFNKEDIFHKVHLRDNHIQWIGQVANFVIEHCARISTINVDIF